MILHQPPNSDYNNSLIDFLKEFDSSYLDLKTSHFKKNAIGINEILVNFYPKLELALQHEINEGLYYNIFEVLKIESLEARVHSPFIVNLLNPNGRHKMGTLFLNLFLFKIGVSKSLEESIKWKLEYIVDELTLSNEKGRADIYMQFNLNGVKRSIIIENKIYADDQKNQLKRYYDYLNINLNLNNNNLRLIYLTIDGFKPKNTSISEGELLKIGSSFIQISYKKHILEWLLDCLNHHLPKRISLLIEQYITIINKL